VSNDFVNGAEKVPVGVTVVVTLMWRDGLAVSLVVDEKRFVSDIVDVGVTELVFDSDALTDNACVSE
jgi:hypothetical protein